MKITSTRWRTSWRLVSTVTWLVAGSACTWWDYQRHGAGEYYEVADDLDDVAEVVDEWGTVSASDPLMLENKGQFSLDYQRSTKEYVDAARSAVHGSALRAVQEARDTQRAVKSDVDIEKAAAAAAAAAAAPGAGAALVAASQALNAASGEGPTTDAADEAGEVKQNTPAFESMLPLERPAKAVLSSDKFRAPLEIGSLPTGISERQALLIGVNDKITENVIKYFANPGVGAASNKKIYLAVLQVSIQPGWRTREDYVGEVNIRPAYAANQSDPRPGCEELVTKLQGPVPWKSSLAYREIQQPFAFSVFPSIEAQTLDLRQSQRSQVAEASLWAEILRSSGAVVQAESLDDWVRRVEEDFGSRNPIPLITAYSNGVSFGYQIRPSFHALDAGADRDGAAHILQPASFPAVIVLIADRDEVEGGKSCWNHIEWIVNSRWIPTKKPWPWQDSGEMQRILVAHDLDVILGKHANLFREDPKMYASSNVGQEIKRRYNLYFSLGQGVTRYSRLPVEQKPKEEKEPGPPSLSSVAPAVGWQNAPTVLAIQGDNFSANGQSLVKQVIVGGVAAEYFVAGTKTIVAVVPAGAFNDSGSAPAEVVVVTTKGVAKARQYVQFTRKATPPEDNANAGISLTRDASGRVVSIVLDGNTHMTPSELLDAIRSVLEREGQGRKISIKVPPAGSVEVGTDEAGAE